MSAFPRSDMSEAAAGALQRLRRLVELESPSPDEAGLLAVAADFAAQLVEAGATVEIVAVPGVGEHVIGRVDGAEPGLAPLMILGHLDTVHPTGIFQPVFQVEAEAEGDGDAGRGPRARGPGSYDMKGGLACALEALHRLHAAGSCPHRPLLVLATCDEETGSEHSRSLIRALAEGVHAVLVPEPPLENGGVKTRRKGVGWYRLDVEGQSSHAGVAPEAGVNAIIELAHQLLALEALADSGVGTTVSACLAGGGTASNVIPDSAHAEVDVRFSSTAEGERLDDGIRALRPALAGARLTVSGGVNRPPMERTEAIGALYDRARRLAAEFGWDLAEGASGGASDGSLTAGQGVPTLDGLGPLGGGAHTRGEHVMVEDLGRRVLLYGRLLETL